MSKNLIVVGFVAVLAAASAGCCVVGGHCGCPGYAGGECGIGCNPVAGAVDCCAAGPRCGNDCCCERRLGPLDFVLGLFNWGCYPCNGCGETYWPRIQGARIGCEGCDHDGNYIGSGCRCGSAVPSGAPAPAVIEGEVIHEGRRPAPPVKPAPAPKVSATPTPPAGQYVGKPRILYETDEVVAPKRIESSSPTPPMPVAPPEATAGAPRVDRDGWRAANTRTSYR